MMTVYLLHYERPIGNPENKRAQAQHYIGSTPDLERRLRQHRSGRSGAGIVAAFHQQGIKFRVARTWEREDGRDFERHLKTHYKNARLLCPVCRAQKEAQGER